MLFYVHELLFFLHNRIKIEKVKKLKVKKSFEVNI